MTANIKLTRFLPRVTAHWFCNGKICEKWYPNLLVSPEISDYALDKYFISWVLKPFYYSPRPQSFNYAYDMHMHAPFVYLPILIKKHSSSGTLPFSPNWWMFKSDQSMFVLVPSALSMNPKNKLKTDRLSGADLVRPGRERSVAPMINDSYVGRGEIGRFYQSTNEKNKL